MQLYLGDYIKSLFIVVLRVYEKLVNKDQNKSKKLVNVGKCILRWLLWCLDQWRRNRLLQNYHSGKELHCKATIQTNHQCVHKRNVKQKKTIKYIFIMLELVLLTRYNQCCTINLNRKLAVREFYINVSIYFILNFPAVIFLNLLNLLLNENMHANEGSF